MVENDLLHKEEQLKNLFLNHLITMTVLLFSFISVDFLKLRLNVFSRTIMIAFE